MEVDADVKPGGSAMPDGLDLATGGELSSATHRGLSVLTSDIVAVGFEGRKAVGTALGLRIGW